MIKLATCVVLAVCLLAPVTFGQAQFLSSDSDGFGASLGYAKNYEASGLLMDFAYAPSNVIDIGMGISTATADEGSDALNISPYLSAWLINENNRREPLSLCFSVSFGYVFLPGRENNAMTSAIGITAHKNLFISESSLLQPYVGFGHQHVRNVENQAGLLAGFVLLVKTKRDAGLMIGNGYSVMDNVVTVSLSVGYVAGSGLPGTRGTTWDDW